MKGLFGNVPMAFVSDTEVYDFKVPVSIALPKIKKLNAVVVTKNGEYYGIVDGRALTGKSSGMPRQMSIGKLAKQVPAISKDSEIKAAIRMFYSYGTKALPFIESGKVSGIVNRNEILKAILSMHLLSTSKVNEIMSTPVIAVDRNASIGRAKAAMKENNVNRLAVLDNGKFYGILTARDISDYSMHTSARLPEFTDGTSQHVSVESVSRKEPYTIDHDSAVEAAIRDFIEKNISSLPVLKNNRPVGILTVRDVLETVTKAYNIPRRNIVVSGLEGNTLEYEDEIISELESLAEKIDRFSKTKVDYIALNVKPIKQREYELRARLGLVKGGAVHVYVSGYSLESVLNKLTKRLYREIKERRDIILAGRPF